MFSFTCYCRVEINQLFELNSNNNILKLIPRDIFGGIPTYSCGTTERTTEPLLNKIIFKMSFVNKDLSFSLLKNTRDGR